jgi:hypothetical protein
MSRPLTVVVLNGWSSSSRGSKTRTHKLVERELERAGADYQLLGLKAMFIYARARRVKKFVKQHEGKGRVLACFGKSLGARNMVKRVLNPIYSIEYDEIHLMTIDPNWPESWDLTPNLNSCTLRLTRPVSRAVNIYYAAPKGSRKQAGAILGVPPGVPCVNEPVTDTDHIKIVEHPLTEQLVRKTIAEAMR